jgi:hypothetical protein
MSTRPRLQDVKAEAHRRHPDLANPERQAKARAELDAYVAGHLTRRMAALALFGRPIRRGRAASGPRATRSLPCWFVGETWHYFGEFDAEEGFEFGRRLGAGPGATPGAPDVEGCRPPRPPRAEDWEEARSRSA